jgi:hypothetical protein
MALHVKIRVLHRAADDGGHRYRGAIAWRVAQCARSQAEFLCRIAVKCCVQPRFLMHLPFAQIEQVTARWLIAGFGYVFATTFVGWEENRDCRLRGWLAATRHAGAAVQLARAVGGHCGGRAEPRRPFQSMAVWKW